VARGREAESTSAVSAPRPLALFGGEEGVGPEVLDHEERAGLVGVELGRERVECFARRAADGLALARQGAEARRRRGG
jgi:hypothetical protein